ncbi:MAG: nucleotidyl transferase AbiEii/AbiGii toxin family protein [Muribaculaceae bacterium]
MSRITNIGKSIRARLLNIAKNEDIFYQTILTRYFQERLLYRLSQTHYKDNFYLKGDALMYAYEKLAARPTLDIDFLGSNVSNDSNHIANIFRIICMADCKEDGVIFDYEKIHTRIITELKDYHGIRITIPVKMDTISQMMTMDIGFGDIITPHPVFINYPLLLEDLPEAKILAYSTETVIAEKFHAIIDLADQSSRMKDYYDIYHLLNSFKYNENTLYEAINSTFSNRHTTYNSDTTFFREDFPYLEQMQSKWNDYINKSTLKSNASFSEISICLQKVLKPYWDSYGEFCKNGRKTE